MLRPVAVTSPDLDPLLRVLLLAEGFSDASSLAKRAAAALSMAAALFDPSTHIPDPASDALTASYKQMGEMQCEPARPLKTSASDACRSTADPSVAREG